MAKIKIPGAPREMALAQGKVPKNLREAVAEQIKKDRDDGIAETRTWDSLMETLLQAYLEQRGAT